MLALALVFSFCFLMLKDGDVGAARTPVEEYIFLNNRAVEIKDRDKKIELYERALGIAETQPQLQHDIPDLLYTIGMYYLMIGNHAKAREAWHRALKGEIGYLEPAQIAEMTERLETMAFFSGDFESILAVHLDLLETGRREFGPRSPRVASILHQVAATLRRLDGKLKGAYSLGFSNAVQADRAMAILRGKTKPEELLQEALAILEETRGREDDERLAALGTLASVYLNDGRAAKAIPFLEEALIIYSQGRNKPGNEQKLMITLDLLAHASYESGDFALAVARQKRAIRIAANLHSRQALEQGDVAYANLFEWLATYQQAQGDFEEARSSFSEAGELLENGLTTQMRGSESTRKELLRLLSFYTDKVVAFHVQISPQDPKAAHLALTSVLRRKGRLLDSMAGGVGVARQFLPVEKRGVLEQLVSARSRLATFVVAGQSERNLLDFQERVIAIEQEINELEDKITSFDSKPGNRSQMVTLERVQEMIPSDAALIELVILDPYYSAKPPRRDYGAPRYVAYILKHTGQPQWVDLGEWDAIDQEARRFRESLDARHADTRKLARSLDQKIMAPIRKILGETRLVLLSPEGNLNLIPFGALLDEEGHYLIEQHRFTYLTSGRDLLRKQSGNHTTKQAPLVIADPDFNAQEKAEKVLTASSNSGKSSRGSVDFSSIAFSPLPGTAGEAQALKRTIRDSSVVVGTQATESMLKKIHGPKILHLATHGFFLQGESGNASTVRGVAVSEQIPLKAMKGHKVENPLLRSGLALAGANVRQSGEEEDGILTALEASGLDLWGTKLVVLSACETGIGQVRFHEGVYGLRRALVMAGSETQVMSLWKVDDEATKDLMVDYYKRLLAGEGRSEALRQVQLSMLKNTATAHPFYWASFIVSGDWRPI